MNTTEIIIEHDGWRAQHDDWDALFASILHSVRTHLNVDAQEALELSVLLSDDDTIQMLNAQFRGKDKPTNVLSFPSGNSVFPGVSAGCYLGDLAFSYQRVFEESEKDTKIFLNHMTHLIIHGILHLLGYDHETNADAHTMETLEIDILKTMHINNPYSHNDTHDA